MFKAIELITESFDSHHIKYRVVEYPDQQEIWAGFGVDCGPSVVTKFITRDNDNDVAVRIHGLFSNIPDEKRVRALEACNILNRKVRFMKFSLDRDNDINVAYDLPLEAEDSCVGEIACEVFRRTMMILDDEYGVFVRALYTDEPLEKPNERSRSDTLLAKLEELKARMEAERAAGAEEGESGAEPESEGEPEQAAGESDAIGSIPTFEEFLRMQLGGGDEEDEAEAPAC